MRRVILNFHGLAEPERKLETGEAPYWISAAQFSDILALADDLKETVDTTFTFDDGNRSDLTIGAEGLARVGRKATFFVLAGRIGQKGSLSETDIQTLRAAGHSIGSHGADHIDWRAADPAARDRELVWARRRIAEVAQVPVEEAAIPFGRYNGAVVRALRAQGYSLAYSSDGGGWTQGQYPVPRTSPRADMALREIEDVLLGREPARARLRRGLSMAVKKRV